MTLQRKMDALGLVEFRSHSVDPLTIAMSILVVIVVPLLLYLIKKCFTKSSTTVQQEVAPNDRSTVTVCLGRSFKVGRLYNSSDDRLLTKKMLWNDDIVKKATTTASLEEEEDVDFEVISNDNLATKVYQLGIETDLSLSVVSESIEVSKSAEYLHDVKTSSRQARVVLKYKRFTKSDKLIMKKPAKFNVDSSTLRDGTATHVVVGVKYGSEAFFVFNQEVPEDEEYDNVCREMESLVRKLPSIAKGQGNLSEKESLLASKLQCHIHSDQPVLLSSSTFNDIISIYKRFLTDTRTEVPKVAWLYPLHLLDKEAPTVHSIEHPLIMKTFNVLDSFHILVTTANTLSKHKTFDSFPALHDQLAQFKTAVEQKQKTFKEELSPLLPEIRQGNSTENKLKNLITDSHDFITLHDNWLNGKKKELNCLSQYLDKLDGFQMFAGQEQFDLFVKRKGGANCIVSLEFQVGQEKEFVLNEKHWCDDTNLRGEINEKLDEFMEYAHANHKRTLWVITNSTDNYLVEEGVILKVAEIGTFEFLEFEFPSAVGKPFAIKKTWEEVQLKWPAVSASEVLRPNGYVISFRSQNDTKWTKTLTNGELSEAKVSGLIAETKYKFKVKAEYSFGFGPESLISDTVITESYPLLIRIQRETTLSEKYTLDNDYNGPPLYKLKTTTSFFDDKYHIKKCEFGELNTLKPTKVIMVMGATGAGKSTLINGMINYTLGVKLEDDFRFKLICDETAKSEAHSQTNDITAYTFYWQDGFQVPYNLTIIDTPGFGDTRGIERDKQIPGQVKQLFSLRGSEGIDQIHGIGFVARSSSVRLTPTQQYIFSSILEIFGNDIKDNIFVMATFADSAHPNVIKAVREAEVPFKTFFSFNNSGLYADRNSEVVELFWKMGCSSFEDLFTHIEHVTPTSLQLTCEVLREREHLQITLTGLQQIIQAGLAKMDTLRKEEEILKERINDMKANENFQYTVKVMKQDKVKLDPGDGAANCINCSMTCHYPCNTRDHNMYECAAMDMGGQSAAKCQVCPGNCKWNDHFNNLYLFRNYEGEEERKSDDLFKRYQDASNEKDGADRMISKLQNELGDLSEQVHKHTEKAKVCIKRLNEIALRPNPMNETDYLDVLIEAEKQGKKEGFQDRISMYSKMREQARILLKVNDEKLQTPTPKKDQKAWWKFWA